MKKRGTWTGPFIVAYFATCGTHAALADDVFIGSQFGFSAKGYTVGQHLPGNAVVNIAECDSISIWNGTKIVVLPGPYKGRLDRYVPPSEMCAPEVMGERESIYDTYFRQVCEPKNACDAVCTAAFQRVDDQAKMKLKCPK